MNNLPVAKESFPFLLISGASAALIYMIIPWISLIPAVVFFFCLLFFRNPNRKVPADENAFLSPADGVVMGVSRVWEKDLINNEMWKITIFLSIFNVHFNRVPVGGTVEAIKYVPGKFFPAFKSHASSLNERNYVVFNTIKGKIMVCQITGFIARRIVCWAKKGNFYGQGERFGLIKFGSCTEVYLPLSSVVLVSKGDKVKGGLSLIGRLK